MGVEKRAPRAWAKAGAGSTANSRAARAGRKNFLTMEHLDNDGLREQDLHQPFSAVPAILHALYRILSGGRTVPFVYFMPALAILITAAFVFLATVPQPISWRHDRRTVLSS
jgi:hypothetical protein